MDLPIIWAFDGKSWHRTTATYPSMFDSVCGIKGRRALVSVSVPPGESPTRALNDPAFSPNRCGDSACGALL